MRVLVTRPEPDASEFAALCRENGLESALCPLMDVVFHDEKVDLAGIGALAFTSANGVRAFARNCTERSLPVFAVGEATAEIAKKNGFGAVHIAGGDVEALAALVARHHAEIAGEILHVAGAARTGDLAGALRTQDISARRIVLYEAREAGCLPQMSEGRAQADWVALFSPRTAALFAKLVKAAGVDKQVCQMRAACLSEAVADAAKALEWRSIHVAKRRNSAAMITLMMENA